MVDSRKVLLPLHGEKIDPAKTTSSPDGIDREHAFVMPCESGGVA
jgi:hypothetical protein